MKSLFIHPPLRSVDTPSSAIPEISGYIKSAGYETTILDLNIDFYNQILTNENIEKTKKYCESILDNQINCKDTIKKQVFDNYKPEIIKYISGQVEKAKNILRSAEFYDTAKYKLAHFIINKALLLLSLPYDTFILHERSIIGHFDRFSVDLYKKIAKDPIYNIFYKYFENKINEILSEKPDSIFILVDIEGQLIPALTLSQLLKNNGFKNVILMGNYIPLIQDELKSDPTFFEEYSTFAMYENHALAVKDFLLYLENKLEINKVRNLLYVENHKVIENKYSYEEPTTFFVQDFEFTKNTKYFFPELVLPLLLTQGCYWGKCKFCDLFSEKYIKKNIDFVIEEIKYYQKEYGAKYFFLRDLSFSPSVAKEFSEKIIKNKLDIRYTSFCRFEKEFDYKLLKQLYKSGLRCFNWGLESGSQKVLDDMKKGIDLNIVSKILKNCHKIGIGNKVSIMYALPGETIEDFNETIKFIINHKKYITSIADRLFFLKRYSYLFNNLNEYEMKLPVGKIQNQYSAAEIFTDFDFSKYMDAINELRNINSIILGSYDEIMLYLDKKPYIFNKWYQKFVSHQNKKKFNSFFK